VTSGFLYFVGNPVAPFYYFALIFHPIMHFRWDGNSLLVFIRWPHRNARVGISGCCPGWL